MFEPNSLISSLTRSIQDLPDQIEFQLQIVWTDKKYQTQIQDGLKIYEELLNRQSIQNIEKLFSTELEKSTKSFIDSKLQQIINLYQPFIKQISYTINPDTISQVNQTFRCLNNEIIQFVIMQMIGQQVGFIEYLQQLANNCMKVKHNQQPAQQFCQELLKMVIITDYISQFLYNDIIIYKNTHETTDKMILQIFMVFNVIIRYETIEQTYQKWFYRCNKRLFQSSILSFEQILDYCPQQFDQLDYLFKQRLIELSNKKTKFEQVSIQNFNQYVFKEQSSEIELEKILKRLKIPITMSSRIHANLLLLALISDSIANNKLQFSMYSMSGARNACFSNFTVMKQTLTEKLRKIQKSYNNKYQSLLNQQSILFDCTFIRSAMEQPIYLKILLTHLVNYCILIQCLTETSNHLTCPNEFQAQEITKYYNLIYEKEKALLIADSTRRIQKAIIHQRQQQIKPSMKNFIKDVTKIQNAIKAKIMQEKLTKILNQTYNLQKYIKKTIKQQKVYDVIYQVMQVQKLQKEIKYYSVSQQYISLCNQLEDRIITIQLFVKNRRQKQIIHKSFAEYIANHVKSVMILQQAYRAHKQWKEEKQKRIAMLQNPDSKEVKPKSNLLSAQFSILQKNVLRARNILACFYHIEKLYVMCYLDNDYIDGLTKEFMLALNSAIYQCNKPVQFKTYLGFLNIIIERKGLQYMKSANKILEPSKVEVLKARRCYYDKYLIKQIQLYDQYIQQEQKQKDPILQREVKKFYKLQENKQ